MHRLIANTFFIVFTSLAIGGVLAEQASAEVVVMTRNVYLGTDLSPVVSAIASHNQAAMVSASSTAFTQVMASNFAERAGALANEIQQTQPALIGLQEV